MRAKSELIKKLLVLTMVGVIGVTTLAETTDKKLLTRQEAVKKAMDMSIQLKTISKQLDATRETMRKKMEDYTTFKTYEYEDMRIGMQQQQQQQDYLKDKIEFSVSTNYNDTLLLQKELLLLNQKIELGTKEVKQAEIKKRSGVLDEVSYQKYILNLNSLKTQKSSKETELKKVQQNFNLLTNIDITQYELEDKITYTPYIFGNTIEFYINSKVNDMVQYNQEAAEYYEETKLDRMLIGDGPAYLVPDKEADLQSKATISDKYSTVEQMKNSYKTSLMNVYASLVATTKQLEELQGQYKVKEKELKVIEIKYNAGLVSAYDYEKAQCEFDELALNILMTTNSCQELQTSIQKPWVAY